MNVLIKVVHEGVDGVVLETSVVKAFVLQAAKEAFAGGIIRRTTFSGHGSGQLGRIHSSNPTRPSIVTPSITMDNRPLGVEPINPIVQHGIHQLGIRARTD